MPLEMKGFLIRYQIAESKKDENKERFFWPDIMQSLLEGNYWKASVFGCDVWDSLGKEKEEIFILAKKFLVEFPIIKASKDQNGIALGLAAYNAIDLFYRTERIKEIDEDVLFLWLRELIKIIGFEGIDFEIVEYIVKLVYEKSPQIMENLISSEIEDFKKSNDTAFIDLDRKYLNIRIVPYLVDKIRNIKDLPIPFFRLFCKFLLENSEKEAVDILKGITVKKDKDEYVIESLFLLSFHSDQFEFAWENSDERMKKTVIERILYNDSQFGETKIPDNVKFIVDMFEFIQENWPVEEDIYRKPGVVYNVTSKDRIPNLRYILISKLSNIETTEAIDELKKISQKYGDLDIGNYYRKSVERYIEKSRTKKSPEILINFFLSEVPEFGFWQITGVAFFIVIMCSQILNVWLPDYPRLSQVITVLITIGVVIAVPINVPEMIKFVKYRKNKKEFLNIF